MKILYLITRSDVIGGASIHVLDLASEMKSKGHDVTLLAGGNGVLHDIASAAGIKCDQLNLQRSSLPKKRNKVLVYHSAQEDLACRRDVSTLGRYPWRLLSPLKQGRRLLSCGAI